MFFSALTRRTGAATGLTMVVVLGLVLGSQYLFNFLSNTAQIGANGLRETPPAAIVYLNPFVAQADVACGTEDGTRYTDYCALVSGIVGFGDQGIRPPQFDPSVPVPCCGAIDGGAMEGIGNLGIDQGISRQPAIVKIGGVAGDPNGGVSDGDVVVDSLSFRDRFWPKTVLSFLALAIVLTLVSIQFVTPTRRLRPSLPGPVRRLIRRRSST
jgi:hypothetical protein